MARAGLIGDGRAAEKRVDELIVASWFTHRAAERSGPVRSEARAQVRLARALDTLGRTADIDRILVAERKILAHQLQHEANTQIMKGSLRAAIGECDQAVVMLGMVRDPKVYRQVDAGHQIPKKRIHDLPKDGGRAFYTAHSMRIKNLQKAVGSKEDKKVLAARLTNVRVAEPIYEDLQATALGKELRELKGRRPKGQDRDHDIEPG